MLRHPAVALERGQSLGHQVEVRRAGPDRLAQVGRGHERRVEMGLLRQQPEAQAALAVDLAAIRLVAPGGQPQQGGLAGAVRSDQPDPVAERDRRVDRVEDDERPDLAGDAGEPEDAHGSGPPRPPASSRPARLARRVAAARFVRSVRARRAARSASRPRQPERALPGQLGPAAPGAAMSTGHRPQDRRGGLAIGGRQALAPRAEVRRARPDDDPLDGAPAARTRLAGSLVDLQVLLHRAVAVGRRVVVDRAAAPLDRLGQDRADRLEQAALVGRAERADGPQRMEPGRPQRLVGVDVADAGDERLVEQQWLEPALAAAQPAAEVAQRERRVERLRPERGEDRRARRPRSSARR